MRQVCTTKCYRTTWQPNHFFQFIQFSNNHKFHDRSVPRVRLAFLESSILHLSICDRRALPNLILLRDGQIMFSKLIFQFSNDHNFHHRSLQEVILSFLECFIFHISIWDGTRWPCLASLNDGPKWSNFQSLPQLAFSSEWSWEPQTWYETISIWYLCAKIIQSQNEFRSSENGYQKLQNFTFVSAHCPNATSPQAHPN